MCLLTNRFRKPFRSVIVAASFFLTTAHAQDDLGGLDDIIELPEFIVQDTGEGGYLKTNTISATRLSANVKDLPIPVEVITSDFIEDTGALSLQDAVQFSAGLETDITLRQAGDNDTDNTAFRLRGFVSEAALRNGFRKIGSADSFNITQVDVVRGPNALLYGVGNFGGVVNYITRRPSSEPSYGLGFTIDDEGGYRISADATGPISETVRYSIATLYSEPERFYDLYEEETTGLAAVIEWQPMKDTTILFDYELLESEGNAPNNNPFRFQFNPKEQLNLQTGVTEQPPYVRTGTFPDPNVGFYDFGGDARLEASNEFENKDQGFLLNVIQKVGDDLSFQFGYYGSERKRRRQNTNVSLTNVNNLLSNPNSEQFVDLVEEFPWLIDPASPEYQANVDPYGNVFSYRWGSSTRNQDAGRVYEEQWRHQFRLEGAYNLPINQWWKNSFVFGATYNEFETNSVAEHLVTVNPDYVAGSDQLNQRFDLALIGIRPINGSSPIRFDADPDEFYAVINAPTDDTKFIEHGAYFIHQGTFWDNRIRTVTGLRYDKSFVKRPDSVSQITGEVTETAFKEDTPSATNFSFGISMQPTKTSPWALYLLSAGAVQPFFSQFDAAGNIIPPTEGQSQEVGLKYDFFDGKVSGTLAVYDVEREGVIENSNEIVVPPEDSDLFNDQASSRALRDDQSRGVDMQTIFSDLPIRNLQTVFNFSYNDYEITDLGGPSYDAATDTIVNQSIAVDTSRRNTGTPEFSVKIWSKYKFTEGPLDGLDFGLGFRWNDEREATLDGNADEPSFIEIDPFVQWDATIGYKFTARDVNYNIRLNIFNLADEDGFYGYSYRSPQGTTARLSLSARF